MLGVPGQKWPVGLGFLHPAARYVPASPEGSIRNSDTGVFNALMTMGIVGVSLSTRPSRMDSVSSGARVATLSEQPNHFPRGLSTEEQLDRWALAGSPTLIVLFSVPGLIMSALVLAASGTSSLSRTGRS